MNCSGGRAGRQPGTKRTLPRARNLDHMRCHTTQVPGRSSAIMGTPIGQSGAAYAGEGEGAARHGVEDVLRLPAQPLDHALHVLHDPLLRVGDRGAGRQVALPARAAAARATRPSREEFCSGPVSTQGLPRWLGQLGRRTGRRPSTRSTCRG